jgi:plastocyanin
MVGVHMRRNGWIVAGVIAALMGSTQAWAGATISGSVKWDGAVPTLKALNMASDPGCVKKYAGKPAPVSQALSLGAGNTMGSVFVSITSGLDATKKHTAPTTPVVITQKGCNYSPHVFGVMVGQPVVFKNEDALSHNVHALPKDNRQFNITMPKTMTTSTPKTFRKAEPMPFRVKCDIHPWMMSYAAVMQHPYFSVTGTDGKWSIKNLPAGTYEIEAWHEKAGTQKSKVTVKDGETKQVDFTFAKK